MKITREQFMEFFRDNEQMEQLSVDDRIELFGHSLLGSSDITKELLDTLISNYSVGDYSDLRVLEVSARDLEIVTDALDCYWADIQESETIEDTDKTVRLAQIDVLRSKFVAEGN